MISDLSTSGAMPVLEAAMRFSAGRQRLLAHNIANFSTPNARMRDVSPQGFQAQLREAVEARRDANAGSFGELDLGNTSEIRHDPATGRLHLTPGTPSGNVLAHDRNDRDLERTMQAMVENAGYFRVASDFMRQQKSQLIVAITERV
ncbi:MAG: flagellar basal body rod protein FlgB [Phycisphaerales bacterium JB040]